MLHTKLAIWRKLMGGELGAQFVTGKVVNI